MEGIDKEKHYFSFSLKIVMVLKRNSEPRSDKGHKPDNISGSWLL